MGIEQQINEYLDYQRDIMEAELHNRICYEQKQADIAEHIMQKQEENDALRRNAIIQRELEEQADLKLAADLRDLADRIERRYK